MTQDKTKFFLDSFELFVTNEIIKRYDPWTYDAPLACNSKRVAQFQALQRAVLILADGIATNFDDLSPWLPYDNKIKRFFNKLSDKPLRAGVFRPDFLITKDSRLIMFEITCRFPLNGIFQSIGLNRLPKIRNFTHARNIEVCDYTAVLAQTFLEWAGESDAVWIIQGNESSRNESVVLQSHFDNTLPLPFVYMPLQSFIALDPREFAGSKAIVAEINFEEWQQIPDSHIDAMFACPLANDPRFVFIAHDKSFFALPFIDEIAANVLEEQEASLLRSHFAKTYLPGKAPEIWENALEHPEDWIIKPRRLGKSKGIIAGGLVNHEDWRKHIQNAAKNDVILQEWHTPPYIKGSIGTESYYDLYCGTLLCWGATFLGPGMIRASSHEVINIKDNRKAGCIVVTNKDNETIADLQWI